MEFLACGARQFNEPGLFLSFEESSQSVIENFRSFGLDLEELVKTKKLKISFVQISRSEVLQSGAFSLDALKLRIRHAIDEIGAKRLALDTVESIFSALDNNAHLRAEMAGLFDWLREQRVTAVVTGERGKDQLTRDGLQEYVSDCIILLDQRVTEQATKRRLRVVKYRGSAHAEDEFPFLIGPHGISVLPITSVNLNYRVSDERLSTGVADLDEMLGGAGYFKGTSVLVTGMAGTGKSSLAAVFALASCQREKRCLYFSFEESPAQILRNMKSIGIDLAPGVETGLMKISSFRPTFRGLEAHLAWLIRETELFHPECAVMDPISNFIAGGDVLEIKSMLTRVLDFLKRRGVTLLMTALIPGSGTPDETELSVSSMVDTWLALQTKRAGRWRRREITIIKSRGMEHWQGSREMILSAGGIAMPVNGMESVSETG
jgi:circadian clock protein KaiC